MTTGKDAGLKPGATLKTKNRYQRRKTDTEVAGGDPGVTALKGKGDEGKVMRGARRRRFRGRWLWRVSRRREKQKLL
jgi:hypothetical protein